MQYCSLRLLLLSCLIIVVADSYHLPQKRRLDYPVDQDCHLCHAIIIESMKKIGNIVSVSNARNMLNSVCKTSSFEGYSLTREEISVFCDRFVSDNSERIQIAILSKQMHRFKESIDNHVCKSLLLCPYGWKSLEQLKEEDVSDLEMEL